ncbi:MAG: hypothetical protein KAI83_12520 [Thiomargarita sp.]|nr:hypothetical protein [Thiomargarita sp.]
MLALFKESVYSVNPLYSDDNSYWTKKKPRSMKLRSYLILIVPNQQPVGIVFIIVFLEDTAVITEDSLHYK